MHESMLSSYKKGEIFENNVLGCFSKSVQTILEFLFLHFDIKFVFILLQNTWYTQI